MVKKNLSPYFSVITCSKYGEGLLRTLKSIQSSDFQDYEVIIVYSEAKSEVFAAKKEYVRDERFQFHVDHSSGIYEAMNLGGKISAGRFLTFLNAGDTYASENSLQSLYKVSKKNSWGYGAIRIREVSGQTNVYRFSPYVYRLHKYLWKYVPHPSSYVSRKLFLSIGGFDIKHKVAADHKFFLTCAQKSKPAISRDVIAEFVKGGVSTRDSREIMRDAEAILNEVEGTRENSKLQKLVWRVSTFLRLLVKLIQRS